MTTRVAWVAVVEGVPMASARTAPHARAVRAVGVAWWIDEVMKLSLQARRERVKP